jgi:hypothetical protein
MFHLRPLALTNFNYLISYNIGDFKQDDCVIHSGRATNEDKRSRDGIGAITVASMDAYQGNGISGEVDEKDLLHSIDNQIPNTQGHVIHRQHVYTYITTHCPDDKLLRRWHRCCTRQILEWWVGNK